MLNSNLLIFISSSLLCALHLFNVFLVFYLPLSWLYIIFHITLFCLEKPHNESWQGHLLHITPGDPSALGSLPSVRTHSVFFLHCINFCLGTVHFAGWGPHYCLAYLSYHIVTSFSYSLSHSNSQEQKKVTSVTQPYREQQGIQWMIGNWSYVQLKKILNGLIIKL